MIQCQTVIESKMAYHDMKKESIGETIVEYKRQFRLFFQSAHTKSPDIAYWLTQPVGRIQFTDTPTEVSWAMNHVGDAAIRERKLTHSQSISL